MATIASLSIWRNVCGLRKEIEDANLQPHLDIAKSDMIATVGESLYATVLAEGSTERKTNFGIAESWFAQANALPALNSQISATGGVKMSQSFDRGEGLGSTSRNMTPTEVRLSVQDYRVRAKTILSPYIEIDVTFCSVRKVT